MRAQVSDVPLPLALSEIAKAQKTDDFCQTVFATLAAQSKSLFFEGVMVSYVACIHRYQSWSISSSTSRSGRGFSTWRTTERFRATPDGFVYLLVFFGPTISR